MIHDELQLTWFHEEEERKKVHYLRITKRFCDKSRSIFKSLITRNFKYLVMEHVCDMNRFLLKNTLVRHIFAYM